MLSVGRQFAVTMLNLCLGLKLIIFILLIKINHVDPRSTYSFLMPTGESAAGAVGSQTLCVCSWWTRNWKEPG